MKKAISILLSITLLLTALCVSTFASDNDNLSNNGTNSEAEFDIVSGADLEINAKSAVLINAETGAVLYAKNPNEALPPASVTKIMTLLLVAEAIEDGRIKLEDKVTVSTNAASMGGSQIFLSEGEVFTVDELLKSAVIASANDAAVALAEHLAGNEAAFVDKMNRRAAELGMRNTVFENCTGLDDTVTKHETSAYDIGLMSKELIKYNSVMKYSCIWQDSIRNGEFTLTNTNRLVRYYQGCTGLKTGSTDKAGFCVSATAKRDGMHLIAVIMGSDTREERNEAARTLLDFGFASYALYNDAQTMLEEVPVRFGTKDSVYVYSTGFSCLIGKAEKSKIEKKYEIPEYISAPLAEGSRVGCIIYSIDDNEIGRCDIIIKESVDKISLGGIFIRLLQSIIVG